jgi:hypothetical protein
MNTKVGMVEPVLSTRELILEFRAKNPNLGEIMLLGDLNARIGLKSPVFEEEDIENYDKSLQDGHPHSMLRASKDANLNVRGKML